LTIKSLNTAIKITKNVKNKSAAEVNAIKNRALPAIGKFKLI